MQIDREKSVCADRCAESGDPPCYEVCRDVGDEWTLCAECRAELGYPPPDEPLDPDAVVAPLL